ncbi:odorant receptor 67c-like [Cryptotermes secundus]|uniref:odorant receptor 67c-like n=1 Tax=Cryptotermes secundus TaxID=105785 RepID=UPI000CD7D757|nr:odorant receptor 67c-like [Cryptotermes secundus]XP_033608623.1 odorant receptor 67c-like [Cryptotermes secundus]
MFLVYFLTSEAMMCMAAFQVAMGDNEGLVKFIVTLANVCSWPLMICWCGDYLTAQSLEVEKIAYGCGWYNRSQKFKKLLQTLISRAQEPVTFTAGKFYTVSLETFANIVNKVYAYFTILKRMHET